MPVDMISAARAKLMPGKVHYATSTRTLDDGRILTCRVTLETGRMVPAKAKPRWFVNGQQVAEPPQ